MNRSALHWLRFGPFLLLLAPLALSGCDRAEIETYSVPRQKIRLLGAIVPSPYEDYWMVKLAGNADAVEAQRAKFMAFVSSMKFDADTSPVRWTVPEGWTEEAGRGMRYASLYISDHDLVVTVFKFGPETANMVVRNVNRWRNQLNLAPISAEEFVKQPRQKIGETEGWIIDLESKTLSEQPIEDYDEKPPASAKLPETPAGWEPTPSTGSQRLAGYRIGKGPESVEMTVTQFPGEVGGLVANVNRWRDQVGLPEADAAKIKTESATLEVGGVKCVYVDVTGPSGKRILGVIYPALGQTIFFKMSGPADAVGKEKAAFEKYASSFQLGGI